MRGIPRALSVFVVLILLAAVMLVVLADPGVPAAPINTINPWYGLGLGIVIVPVLWFLSKQYARHDGMGCLADILGPLMLKLALVSAGAWAFFFGEMVHWVMGLIVGILAFVASIEISARAEEKVRAETRTRIGRDR